MKSLIGLAGLLVVLGVVMLVAGIGASLVWFGSIASGCALFVVVRTQRPNTGGG